MDWVATYSGLSTDRNMGTGKATGKGKGSGKWRNTVKVTKRAKGKADPTARQAIKGLSKSAPVIVQPVKVTPALSRLAAANLAAKRARLTISP